MTSYEAGMQFAGWQLYQQMDETRCWQGRMLDTLGWGPVETPSRVVLSAPGVTLKAYAGAGDAGEVLVLVPAPIKRAYIFDLARGASVVREALLRGLRVYLVEWEAPQPGSSGPGLADYAGRLLPECLDAIAAETGVARMYLAGHSLGGTLAALCAAARPDRVKGLAVVAAPFHFAFEREAGALGPVLHAVAQGNMLEALGGHVPGSFLSMAGFAAAPDAFGGERLRDWVESLPDPAALQTHLRVERWTLDELPLARAFVEDVLELLYRQDRFLQGGLEIGGRQATPEAIEAPLVTVADERCAIVPPAAVLPFHERAGSRDKRLLWYEGDTGVAIRHVGVLVGRSARERLWPEIFDWLESVAKRQ